MKNLNTFVSSGLLVVLSLGGLVVDLPTALAAPPTDEEALDGLHDRLQEIIEELYVPGLAVAVVRDDEVIHLDAVGVRDTQQNLPVTPDTVFYIASCTKTYMAMAAAALAEAGKLDLDAPVKQYLPKFLLADAELTESVTVRDLLCHAKGINSTPIVWLDAYTGQITEERYYHWLKEVKPTGSHEYTNVHYTLAGRVIESVTGESWKDYLDRRIFERAGMTRTTCYASRMYALEDVAIPAIRKDGGFALSPVRKTDQTMHAAGGIGTSVRDLGRWIVVNLNEGSIDGKPVVSAESARQMQTLQDSGERRFPPFAHRTFEGHGLGWSIGTYRGERVLDHGGGYVGAAAMISFMPDQKIGVAVAANGDGAVALLVTMEVFDRLLGIEGNPELLSMLKDNIENRLARVQAEAQAFGANPAEGAGLSLAPRHYAGRYESSGWGTVEIKYRDGRLLGTAGALSLSFGSRGPDRFVVDYGISENDQGRFEIDGDRVTALVLDPSDYEGEIRFERSR